MYDTMTAFLEKDLTRNAAEKRKLAIEMITLLDDDELSQAIEDLGDTFLSHQLKDFLVDQKIPEEHSAEFRFLVQAQKYNGNIARKEMIKSGISAYSIQKFIEKYRLKEVASGFYLFPNKQIDGAFLFQMQYTKSVISHETALYYLGLSDVVPRQTIMSMPKKYKLTQLYQARDAITPYRNIFSYSEFNRSGVRVEYAGNDPIFVIRNSPIEEKQIVSCKTHYNNCVRVTSMERSIVDVLNPASRIEEEIKVEALRRYFKLDSAKKNRLRRIADELKLLEELDNYLWKLKLH